MCDPVGEVECVLGKPHFDKHRALVQRRANGLAEAFFEGSERISARSILRKIKGCSRFQPFAHHTAVGPQKSRGVLGVCSVSDRAGRKKMKNERR